MQSRRRRRRKFEAEVRLQLQRDCVRHMLGDWVTWVIESDEEAELQMSVTLDGVLHQAEAVQS